MHHDRELAIQNRKQSLQRFILLRTTNTARRARINLLRFLISLRIKQHLPNRRKDAHQRAGITAATQRCEANLKRHRRTHDHFLRRVAGKIDQRRLSDENSGSGCGQGSRNACGALSFNLISARTQIVGRHDLRLQSSRLS